MLATQAGQLLYNTGQEGTDSTAYLWYDYLYAGYPGQLLYNTGQEGADSTACRSGPYKPEIIQATLSRLTIKWTKPLQQLISGNYLSATSLGIGEVCN